MSKYKFINFENPVEEMNYIYRDSRNTQKIFQRDREIHIVSTVEETLEDYYVIICFFGDRYFCTFALNEPDLFWFKADIMSGVDYKTIMMDLLAKDAYTVDTDLGELGMFPLLSLRASESFETPISFTHFFSFFG